MQKQHFCKPYQIALARALERALVADERPLARVHRLHVTNHACGDDITNYDACKPANCQTNTNMHDSCVHSIPSLIGDSNTRRATETREAKDQTHSASAHAATAPLLRALLKVHSSHAYGSDPACDSRRCRFSLYLLAFVKSQSEHENEIGASAAEVDMAAAAAAAEAAAIDAAATIDVEPEAEVEAPAPLTPMATSADSAAARVAARLAAAAADDEDDDDDEDDEDKEESCCECAAVVFIADTMAEMAAAVVAADRAAALELEVELLLDFEARPFLEAVAAEVATGAAEADAVAAAPAAATGAAAAALVDSEARERFEAVLLPLLLVVVGGASASAAASPPFRFWPFCAALAATLPRAAASADAEDDEEAAADELRFIRVVTMGFETSETNR